MDIEYYKNLFVKRLKEQMKGKSVTVFSRQLGISARKINYWFRRNTFPRPKDLVVIAKKLGLKINYLLGLDLLQ